MPAPVPAAADEPDDDEPEPLELEPIAEPNGLDASSDDSWKGEKLDKLTSADSGDEPDDEPDEGACAMLPEGDEPADAMSLSVLM